jgi:hypothetical protein
MSTYKIRYKYSTGDSFNPPHDEDGVLELSWTFLDVAKENMNRIKEHYEHYTNKDIRYLTGKALKERKEEIKKQLENKPWRDRNYETSIILVADNGNPCMILPPWIGYFEDLKEIEIIEDVSDRKITFGI